MTETHLQQNSSESIAYFKRSQFWKKDPTSNSVINSLLENLKLNRNIAAWVLIRGDVKLVHVSVCLPKKESEDARKKFKNFVHVLGNEHKYDAVIMAGVFNMKPSELKKLLGNRNYNYAIKDDEVKTTKGNNSIDNVVTSKTLLIKKSKIHKKCSLLKHFPLSVIIRSKDQRFFPAEAQPSTK